MAEKRSTARAHPNIAFIKYWGNRDHHLRLPSNGSISMNLASLQTKTEVRIDTSLKQDIFTLNGIQQSGVPLERVQSFMGIIRKWSESSDYSLINSENNFPDSAGLASSASGFAALAAAASAAYGLGLSTKDLSRLARRGSGSAARSIPSGFVEWYAGHTDEDSYAKTIAPADHWDLADCIAIIKKEPKETGSTAGHQIAATSPIQKARVLDCSRRLDICRQAIKEKDFSALAEIIELDSNLLHAVMMSSTPPLLYWSGISLEIMKQVARWRKEGIPAAYTLDAGPNVHVICEGKYQDEIIKRLDEITGVLAILPSRPGNGACMLGLDKINNLPTP
jgi:diphosphomevalonate decarboxylase